MTVPSTARKVGPFSGNGATTSFPFTIKVFTTADIELTLTDPDGVQEVLVLDSDYTVSLNADQDANPGGTITYPAAGSPMASGYTLAGVGSLADGQSTDITNLGRFLPQVIENAFDYVVILCQQLSEVVSRGIRFPVGDAASVVLPAAAARAGMSLAFDEDGNVVVGPALGDLTAALATAEASAATAAASAAAALVSEASADTSEAVAAAAAAAALTYRDSLLSTAGVYASTAAGLAATASGGYFAVPSGVSGESFIIYLDNAGSAAEVTRLVSSTAYTTTLDAITKSTYRYTQETSSLVYGCTGTPVSFFGLSSNTYTFAAPVPKDAQITAVQFYASGAGTIKLKRLNSSYVEQASVTLTCAAGLNTYTTRDIGNFPILAGEHVGFYTTKGYYTTAVDTRAAYYDGGAGDLTNPAHATLTSSQVPQVQVTVNYLATNASGLNQNNASMSRLRDEARILHRLGPQGDTIADGTATSGAGHFLFIDRAVRAGRISKFRIYSPAQQYVTLYAWDRSGDTATRRADQLDVFLVPAGYSETSLDIPIEAGVYLSLQCGGLRSINPSKVIGRGYHSVASTTVLFDGSVAATTNIALQVAIELEYPSYVHQVQKHEVGLSRVDSIALISNSYGSGSYQPYKKTWPGIFSQMSAWNFYNYSVSSQSLANRLAAIRSADCVFYTNQGDGNTYGSGFGGVNYRDFRTTYVLILLASNTTPGALFNEAHDILETCRSLGAVPILATELANQLHHAAVFRQLAESYGGHFIDVSQYLTMFPSVYAPFQSGGHYGYRVAGTLYATHLVRAIEALIGQPRNGLKIYRPRPGVSYAVAADLMFEHGDDLRHGLSSKWQELVAGGNPALVADVDVGFMDTLTGVYSTGSASSEYLPAMLGHAISFTDYALLAFHLDAQPEHCREVRVFVGTGHDAVYVRDVFTTGSYATAGAQQGFWTACNVTSDGWAVLREWEVNGKLSGTGRIDFLVKHAGAFTMANPRAEWWGSSGRTKPAPVSLARPRGSELITTTTPYTAGALSAGWSSTGAPTYAATANGADKPKNTTGYARLTSTDTISFAITGITADPYLGREIEISVWASAERALVNSATYPTGASMTGDSWDCEQINIDHVSGVNYARSVRTLMPYWQEVRVKTWLEAAATTATVRLGCATTGAVLVARASCKLVDA